MEFHKHHWIAVALLNAVVSAGCGGQAHVPVEGTITFDGKPLSSATITLQKNEGPNEERTFRGTTDSSGKYQIARVDGSAQGAPAGQYSVFITTVQIPPDVNETTKLPKEPIPLKWRNGSQTVDVPASGATEANFAITSR